MGMTELIMNKCQQLFTSNPSVKKIYMMDNCAIHLFAKKNSFIHFRRVSGLADLGYTKKEE
jgi:hypothetical protein